MISITESLFIFFLSFLGAFIVVPIWIAVAKRFEWLDCPVEGKIHQRPIPTAGGVPIILVFYFTIWVFFFLYGEFSPLGKRSLEGLTLAGAVILIVGIYDDLKRCKPLVKLFFQIIAAAILYLYGLGVDKVTNPFGDEIPLEFLNVPITIFWVILIVNAINLIDGLDGLASGIVFIASLTIYIVASNFGEGGMAVPSLILAGSTLGFLRYNFSPAKVFLGDTGSMFLGLIMASISLYGNRKGTVTATLLLPIVLMGVPLLDTLFAFFRRTFSGQNPFRHDTRHFHHRLLALGLSQKRVVLFFYLICIYLSLTAMVLSIMPKQYAFLVLLILGIGVLIGIEALKFIEERIKSSHCNYSATKTPSHEDRIK